MSRVGTLEFWFLFILRTVAQELFLKYCNMYKKKNIYIYIRRLVGSTDQACSSGFYFRIAWKSTERPCFLQNNSLSFLQGLRSLKNWLLQKLSMKSLDQKLIPLEELVIFGCSYYDFKTLQNACCCSHSRILNFKHYQFT